MGEILPFSFAKCCFRFDLVIGCAVYVTVEVYLWAMLSLASIYSEVKLIQNNEIGAFKNFTQSSSYYVTTFGIPANNIGRAVIFTQIAVNGFLGIGFALYCICSVILLIGISERNLGYFIPYLYLDSMFLYLSLVGIILGFVIQNQATFRNCLIFALKFYPSSCIYSLFKKIGGRPITFSNYTTMGQAAQNCNPAIRLARSDSDFETATRRTTSDLSRPRVSFSTITEELQPSSYSEPTISPTNVKRHEISILKPCVRKNLQLPINNSYP